jgi:lipopolysaccharide export LptBFGC system permease protein LptF
MSLYRVVGYLALIAIPVALVAFALGHPLGSLAVQMGSGR